MKFSQHESKGIYLGSEVDARICQGVIIASNCSRPTARVLGWNADERNAEMNCEITVTTAAPIAPNRGISRKQLTRFTNNPNALNQRDRCVSISLSKYCILATPKNTKSNDQTYTARTGPASLYDGPSSKRMIHGAPIEMGIHMLKARSTLIRKYRNRASR